MLPKSLLTPDLRAFIEEFDLVITSPDTAFEGAFCSLPISENPSDLQPYLPTPEYLFRKNSGLFVNPKYVYLDGQLCLFEDELS